MSVEQVKVVKLLERILEMPDGSLTGDEDLSTLTKWDSLAVISFISAADEQFGVTLPPARLNAIRSIAEVTQLLQSLRAE